MNEIFLSLGMESWKPVLTALLLPPVPMLLLVLVGARLMFKRRLLAWLLILMGVVSLWLACTGAVSQSMVRWLTDPPPALSETALNGLKRAPKTAIVVLGGGRRAYAPEYGMSTLHSRSVERLRYGLWLSRETNLPVAFSGGVGHGAREGPSEAEIAARVAEREFGRPLRWIEGESRDTRENAVRSVALLKAQGIERIVLVTHDYHMRRSLLNFERAAAGSSLTVVAAPLGMPNLGPARALDWLPQHQSMEESRLAIHEWLGRLAGA